MNLLSVLLAQALDPTIAIPVTILVTGIVGTLILKGNVHTDAEMRERLAAQKEAHDKEVELLRQGYDESSKMQKQAHDFQILALTERMDGIIHERDAAIGEKTAWKSAAEWNNEGRIEAQHAAAVVLDAGNVSGAMLGFVRQLVSERTIKSDE